ncbi:hypothetical protein B0T20DRAFT_337457, partial [Sordaria brevicollis]
QNTWKMLYRCVTNVPDTMGGTEMSPQELLGATNAETRENLKRWEKEQDQREGEHRRLGKELHKEFERKRAQGIRPDLPIIGLPPRDEDDENE